MTSYYLVTNHFYFFSSYLQLNFDISEILSSNEVGIYYFVGIYFEIKIAILATFILNNELSPIFFDFILNFYFDHLTSYTIKYLLLLLFLFSFQIAIFPSFIPRNKVYLFFRLLWTIHIGILVIYFRNEVSPFSPAFICPVVGVLGIF